MAVYLKSNMESLNKAFRIAAGDLAGNIAPWPSLYDGTARPVILAGMEYDRPWTRDAAINTWNGAALAEPETARNTLEAVLIKDEQYGDRIGGQYWDAVIWVTGSWHYYLYTGDRKFLERAFRIARNSLAYFEETEWDEEAGLFRGAPCYADGISAYPERYTNVKPYHDIHFWPQFNRDKAAPKGEGVPILPLSTNCLYYNAYRLLGSMARELGEPEDPRWEKTARRIRESLQRFWMADKGHFRYFEDPEGGSNLQEGMGHSFALLLGIADEEQARAVLDSQYVAPAGIPCLHPVMDRYRKEGHTGRHNGTVWPPIQAFWAEAALRRGRKEMFFHEFDSLTRAALRDGQFGEVFHPETGEEYGGLQEDPSGEISEYFLCHRQTWSATGYLRMVLSGLAGLECSTAGLTITPCLPEGCDTLDLTGLTWRGAPLELHIRRGTLEKLRVNGRDCPAETVVAPDPEGIILERVTV